MPARLIRARLSRPAKLGALPLALFRRCVALDNDATALRLSAIRRRSAQPHWNALALRNVSILIATMAQCYRLKLVRRQDIVLLHRVMPLLLAAKVAIACDAHPDDVPVPSCDR